MRCNFFSLIALLGLFIICVKAWTNEDLEVFKINDEVKKDLGDDVTFYSWLDLPKGPKSTFEEINKAYRKLSRKIHPDKIKPTKFGNNMKKFKRVKKKFTERYQRLSVVGEILRSRQKERYDFFLSNGFPKYKNNTWLYEKFRPGVISVFVGLFLVVGVFQYFILRIQTNQNRKKLEDTIFQIKRQAWPSGIPPSDGSDRRLKNEYTGKTFLVKVDGSVHVADQNDPTILHSVNPDDIVEPSFQDTIIFKLPIWLWNTLVGKAAPGLVYIPPKGKTTKQREQEAKEKQLNKKDDFKSASKSKGKNKNLGEKIALPNGKVAYARKKKN